MPSPPEALSALEHDLTENAVEFLRRAVGEVRAKPVTLKRLAFGVVDLAAAIEVLLKARLTREHWTLICADPDKATPADLRAGTLFTVTPEQAIKRLDGIAGIPLKADGHQNRILELARLRNRAIHFTMAGMTTVGLQAALAKALDFVLWFLSREFRDTGAVQTDNLIEELIIDMAAEVGNIKVLVRERMVSIAEDLRGARLSLSCPTCKQPALMILDGEQAHCAFCLTRAGDGEEAALEYVDVVLGVSYYVTVKDGGEWPIRECPSCVSESLVEGVLAFKPAPAAGIAPQVEDEHFEPAQWACFTCGFAPTSAEIGECDRCGRLVRPGRGDSICSSCWDDILGRD